MKYKGEEVYNKAIETVAALMVAAAKTAPKGCGQNSMETLILDGAEKDALAAEMRHLGEKNNQEFYVRDAENVKQASCIILFGAQNTFRGLANCGYCGFGNCFGADNHGAHCTFSVGDLGVAMGSAVSVAAAHHIDNRIMFSAGRTALSMSLFSEKVFMAYGVPLSITEKSPFYDRAPVAPASSAPVPGGCQTK